MLATDKVHKNRDNKPKGKDPSKPDSLASWNDQIFKDRLHRFKKASGKTVPAPSVKKPKTKATSANKSNSSHCCNNQRTLTDKCNIQRTSIDKCHIQKSFTGKCNILRTSTEAGNDSAAKHDDQGTVSTCSQAAELRHRLQTSVHKQRLLATLALTEQERKEAESGYRMSSNGVLVFTKKPDIYKTVDVLSPNTEDKYMGIVSDSNDSADECKTNTSYEEEEDDGEDYDIDLNKKPSNDSRYKYTADKDKDNNLNTGGALPEEYNCIGEQYNKNISGSQLKTHYIFDSADMECYDHSLGKPSFILTDYLGNYQLQQVQGPKLTEGSSNRKGNTEENTTKELYVPDLAIFEEDAKAGPPKDEKPKATANDWLKSIDEKRSSTGGQTDTRTVNESYDDKEKHHITLVLENEDIQSTVASQEGETNREVAWVLDQQDTRLETETKQYAESKEGTFVIEHEDSNSVMESMKCEEDSEVLSAWDHQIAVNNSHELHSRHRELKYTLELQNGGGEHQKIESELSSEKYAEDKQSIRCNVESPEICGENGEIIKSTFESQIDANKKQGKGSVLLLHGNDAKYVAIGSGLLSQSACEERRETESISIVQEDTVGKQGVGHALENSENVEANNKTASDVSVMPCTLMPYQSGCENRGDGFVSLHCRDFNGNDVECVSRQNGASEDTDISCTSREPRDFENNHVGCFSEQHGDFEENDAVCVSSQDGDVEDNDAGCLSMQHGHFEDNIRCVSRQGGDFEDSIIKCVSPQREDFEDNNIKCVSQQHRDFEENNIKCVSPQHGDFEDENCVYVSEQDTGFETNNVGCVSQQHVDFEDNEVECVSKLHGGFEDNDCVCIFKQHEDLEANNVGCISRQRDFGENVEFDSRQCQHFENNNFECVPAQHANFENNDGIESVDSPHDRVQKHQNLECVSGQPMEFEERQKEWYHNKENQKIEIKLYEDVDKSAGKRICVEHVQEKHEKIEYLIEPNKNIQNTRETKSSMKNDIAVDASNLVNSIEGRNVEQEQCNHGGDISPLEGHEMSSEDNSSKGDLARELVFFRGFQSRERKHASPYSKFGQLHDDLVKRLTNPSGDLLGSDNGDCCSEFEYKYNEHIEEEHYEGTDYETDEEPDKVEEGLCCLVQPTEMGAQGYLDKTAGRDTAQPDQIWKENEQVVQNHNSWNLSLSRCENKLEGTCDVKKHCLPHNITKDGVLYDNHKTSRPVKDIEANTDQRLLSNTCTPVLCKDHMQAGISKEIRGLHYSTITVSPISSNTFCSKEASELKIIQNQEISKCPDSTGNLSDYSVVPEDINGGSNVYSCKVEHGNAFDLSNQQDNSIDNVEKPALGLVELQKDADNNHAEDFATSSDRYERLFISNQQSPSHSSVTVCQKNLVNVDKASVNYRGSFLHHNDCTFAYENDDNNQDNGIVFQDGAVYKIANEKPVDKTSMIELRTVLELGYSCMNHTNDLEQANLTRNVESISSLKNIEPLELVDNVVQEVNLPSDVDENFTCSTIFSKAATESFTEVDLGCSNYCFLGSNPASGEVHGCVPSQANTPVCSAVSNEIIEEITGINSTVLCNTSMNGDIICNTSMKGQILCEENKGNGRCHKSEVGENTKTRLSISKGCSDHTLIDTAIYDQTRSDHYGNGILTATTHWKSSEVRKGMEEEFLDNEIPDGDISENDLDFLHQKLESQHTIAVSGDFTTPAKTTRSQETDKKLSELLSVQRKTCEIMMKNVLRRADKSKNLDNTKKTKPATNRVENKDQSPLFCMVTGSKIQACVKQRSCKAMRRSDMHTAISGQKAAQQPLVRSEDRKNCQTKSKFSNVNQSPENLNRRNSSKKFASLGLSNNTARSEIANDVNAKQVKSKSKEQSRQVSSQRNMKNVITDQNVKKPNLKQEKINEQTSFTNTTGSKRNDSTYSGKHNDQLPISKIPRRIKTFPSSETKHTRRDKNTNYSEVGGNIPQLSTEASDVCQSMSREIRCVSVIHKDNFIYTESHHDQLIFTDSPSASCPETQDLGKSPKGMNCQQRWHILKENNEDILTKSVTDENEITRSHASNHLYQTKELGEKLADNYFKNDSAITVHAKENVVTHGLTKHFTPRNSPQLMTENCHCYNLENSLNQDNTNQPQQTFSETDRAVSVNQRSVTQAHEILSEKDGTMYVNQCLMGQPHKIICETERTVSVNQWPLDQTHEILCETERSSSVKHSSNFITNLINHEQITDISVHPNYNSQTKHINYHNQQLEHIVGDTHVSRSVSEQECSSGILHLIDNKQGLSWNNQMSGFTITPVADVTGKNLVSDTPKIREVHKEFAKVMKGNDLEITTILSNTGASSGIARTVAKSMQQSSKNMNIITSVSEDQDWESINEKNTFEVSTWGVTNSDKVRNNMPVCNSPASETVTFRSMVKNMMDQSEDFDNDPASLSINERRIRNELVFPISPLGNYMSNNEKESPNKLIDHDTEKDNKTQADINDDNLQKLTNTEAVTWNEGIDTPSYAELKARALAKALPVLSKLKLQSGKYVQNKPIVNAIPSDIVVERVMLQSSQINDSLKAKSLKHNQGREAEMFTNGYFEEEDIGNSGSFVKNKNYYNCLSVFNINNSKSEEGIDRDSDNIKPSQNNSEKLFINSNIDQNNLAKNDIVSVTTRDKTSLRRSSNEGRFHRKCRIPVRQNRGAQVLSEGVKVKQDKKSRNIVMVLKSKNKSQGGVAAALSLIRHTESNMSNAEDTKPISKLPKHVQVFARGNRVVVEVCADSSSTAASASNTEHIRAPLAERIKKYQQERPRNIFAGRHRTQDDNVLESASKHSKKTSDISSCSEVSSITSNLQVQSCEQASKPVNKCVRIDNTRESDASTPRSSKTFNVSNDEDVLIASKSIGNLPVKEDVAIQTSDNTSASAVTVEKTQLTIQTSDNTSALAVTVEKPLLTKQKKDAAEQVSMSSHDKSNKSTKEHNANAVVTESKSLGESDSFYKENNSKTSNNPSIISNLAKTRAALSEARNRYLKKTVAFSSKLTKNTPEITKNHRHNSAKCASKHTVATLHSRYQDTPEKSTKCDATNIKRQQRYKKLERPACVEQTSQNTNSNLMSNCQLFSPSSRESVEPSLQQGPEIELETQESIHINIQNIETQPRNVKFNSRNSNTADDQDVCKQNTILPSIHSKGKASFFHLDDNEMRSDFNSGMGLQNKDCYLSPNNKRIDASIPCDTGYVCERDGDNLESPECIMLGSRSASHTASHCSQWEIAEPQIFQQTELQIFQQTELAVGKQTVLPNNIDSSSSLKSMECETSLPDSSNRRTKDVLRTLTNSPKLSLEICAHNDSISDSEFAQMQMMNIGGVPEEVSCAQITTETSEVKCDGHNGTQLMTESVKLEEIDNYEKSTLDNTTGHHNDVLRSDCPSTIKEEAMESNKLTALGSCHIPKEELFVNDSKRSTGPCYKGILPSASNKQKENFLSPIPATVSPTTSTKHPKRRSLLMKSMIFTAEDSSGKSSLRSNENGNAHVHDATRKSESYNPLSTFRSDSQLSGADKNNLTHYVCPLPDENRSAEGIERQADRSIYQTVRSFDNNEHDHVYLSQNDSEVMFERSARINSITPRLYDSKNNFSPCLQPHKPGKSETQIKLVERLRTTPGIVNNGRRREDVKTPYHRQSLSCEDKQKETEMVSSNYKQDLENKISTPEVLKQRADLCTTQIYSVVPAARKHKDMTTPRKGKLTFTSLDLKEYERLSPEFINSCESLSYSTTSQESTAATYVYSSHGFVPAPAGHLKTSNDTEPMPSLPVLSAPRKQSSRASEEMLESGNPKLSPLSSGQSGLPPLSSRQSGLPHRPHFKRYY